MKKTAITALIFALAILILASCGGGTDPQTSPTPQTSPSPAAVSPTPEPLSGEIVVFAAASMKESMEEIAQLYKAVEPGVTVTFNFDSSGTLKTQIENGADCDIFISAGQKQMNELDISASPSVNTAGLDFVLAGTRFNIVENKVVMIVPEGSEEGITSFEDVMTDKVALIALGNSDVPVGQYSQEIYTNLGVWDDLVASGKVSYGSNVKEVLAQVAAAAVDCGIVYSTDAATAEGVEIAANAPDGSHSPIIYPAAILNVTQNEAAAESFVEFLQGADATAVLERIGFSIPG